MLAVPAAFTVPTGAAHWEVLLRARAIETQCYVIAAAQASRAWSWRRYRWSSKATVQMELESVFSSDHWELARPRGSPSRARSAGRPAQRHAGVVWPRLHCRPLGDRCCSGGQGGGGGVGSRGHTQLSRASLTVCREPLPVHRSGRGRLGLRRRGAITHARCRPRAVRCRVQFASKSTLDSPRVAS